MGILIGILVFLICQLQGLEVRTDICKIVYEGTDQTFNLISCSTIDQCVDGSESSDSQCAAYTFSELTAEDCVTTCCPQMTISVLSTVAEVDECYAQYIRRLATLIGTVVGSIFLIAIILIIIGLTCIYGYQTNPYTGERKYVGCLCCKKPADFTNEDNKKEQVKEEVDPMEWAATHRND